MELRREIEAILSQSAFLRTRGGVEREAELIVMTVADQLKTGSVSRLELVNLMRSELDPESRARCLQIASRRAEGALLQHELGNQWFLDHPYRVSPAVLVPRPETEILVRAAIERLPKDVSTHGLEIGLGSGAITGELLSALPKLSMIATEASLPALEIALENLNRILGLDIQGRFQSVHVEGSRVLLDPAETGPLDFIVSNPPYLLRSEAEAEVIDHEPHLALFAPLSDPLYFYREIAGRAREVLRPGGQIFVEIPDQRADEIRELFVKEGFPVEIVLDLNARPRVIIAKDING